MLGIKEISALNSHDESRSLHEYLNGETIGLCYNKRDKTDVYNLIKHINTPYADLFIRISQH